jgi:serine/threonine protein phosphatase PrpC
MVSGAFIAQQLSNDHKPDRPEERKRILTVGGHVGCRQVLVNQPGKGPVSMPVGPCRVWYQHRGETLGLAMSRSLGDLVVHRCGVSAEPEVTEIAMQEEDEFLILATDGVWDVVDCNQAVQVVSSFIKNAFSQGKTGISPLILALKLALTSPDGSIAWNTMEASNALVRFARNRWEKMSPMVDDITAIVIKLRR